MPLECVKYDQRNNTLSILDQLQLPQKSVYISLSNTNDGWSAIKNMQVRGAPAIASVGCLSLVVEIMERDFLSSGDFIAHISQALDYLVSARPTGINMQCAATKLKDSVRQWSADGDTIDTMKTKLAESVQSMRDEDQDMCKRMGAHGAEHILQHHVTSNKENVRVLTHCNTGALATAGHGTALGVVHTLHALGRLEHCYVTETRPFNQGARLTAYELVHDNIPGTLVCDSAVAALMGNQKIHAVVVGADRIVSNGDTANKIGTYQLAILAQHHNIPMYVVAHSTTCDLSLEDGAAINIEQRPVKELTHMLGVRVAAEGIITWNPAFDVTPAELITGGIVTEFGVCTPAQFKDTLQASLNSQGH